MGGRGEVDHSIVKVNTILLLCYLVIFTPIVPLFP